MFASVDLIPGGHYAPALGQTILRSNSIYVKNFKGIGDGFNISFLGDIYRYIN